MRRRARTRVALKWETAREAGNEQAEGEGR